jgi:hypothetical protein
MTVFRAVLESTGGNNVGIVVPEEIVLAFDRGKRVPVIEIEVELVVDPDR